MEVRILEVMSVKYRTKIRVSIWAYVSLFILLAAFAFLSIPCRTVVHANEEDTGLGTYTMIGVSSRGNYYTAEDLGL